MNQKIMKNVNIMDISIDCILMSFMSIIWTIYFVCQLINHLLIQQLTLLYYFICCYSGSESIIYDTFELIDKMHEIESGKRSKQSHLWFYFSVYHERCLCHLFDLSIDKSYFMSRNDDDKFFYANYNYFDCIFTCIVSFLHSNNGIVFIHYVLYRVYHCCILFMMCDWCMFISWNWFWSFMIILCIVLSFDTIDIYFQSIFTSIVTALIFVSIIYCDWIQWMIVYHNTN